MPLHPFGTIVHGISGSNKKKLGSGITYCKQIDIGQVLI